MTPEPNSECCVISFWRNKWEWQIYSKTPSTVSILNPCQSLWLENTRVKSNVPRLFCQIKLKPMKEWKYITVVSTQNSQGKVIFQGYGSDITSIQVSQFSSIWAVWSLLLWPWQPLPSTCVTPAFHLDKNIFHPAKELYISANSEFSKMVDLQVVTQFFRWANQRHFLAVLLEWKKRGRKGERSTSKLHKWNLILFLRLKA